MNVIVVPCLLIGLVACQAKPAPKPADIDYEVRLNYILSKGITPERNANVLIWKALGPTPEGGTGMPAEFFKRLGIPEPPNQGDYFVGMTWYLRDHLKLDRGDWDTPFDQQVWATKKPWNAKDYPRVAAWLKLNEKPLVIVIEATKRPEYYNPLVSPRTGDEPGFLINALLPGVQKCRELAIALSARALLRVEGGKLDEAWQDLLATHRLGRHLARGATLIESLVGIAICQISSNATLGYLERADLTTKQAIERLKDLLALPPIPPMADKIDTGERLVCLNSLQLIRRGGGMGKKATPEERKGLDMIDWEPPLRNCNKMYDRMAAALRVKDRPAREKELDRIEQDLNALIKKNSDLSDLKKLIKDAETGQVSGEKIGDVVMALLAPAIRKVQSAFYRSEQVSRNLNIAFALAAYHRDTGHYPAKLDDLVPKYLVNVQNDLFSGKPLVYKPTEKGYLFYSVGQNEKDEEGRSFDDDPRGDDLCIRMPLPELKRNK